MVSILYIFQLFLRIGHFTNLSWILDGGYTCTCTRISNCHLKKSSKSLLNSNIVKSGVKHNNPNPSTKQHYPQTCFWLAKIKNTHITGIQLKEFLHISQKCPVPCLSICCLWDMRKLECPEKTIDLSQVTDKLYHIMLYWVLPAWMVIGTDCIDSCKVTCDRSMVFSGHSSFLHQ
jgi:hypothetical protein